MIDLDRYVDALVDRLREAEALRDATRRMIPLSNLTAKAMPFLELRVSGVAPQWQGYEMPPVWGILMDALVWITLQPSEMEIPDAVLNGVAESVAGVLERRPGERDGYGTTLGGLVERCYISGTVEYGYGDSPDAEIRIPITMTVPGN